MHPCTVVHQQNACKPICLSCTADNRHWSSSNIASSWINLLNSWVLLILWDLISTRNQCHQCYLPDWFLFSVLESRKAPPHGFWLDSKNWLDSKWYLIPLLCCISQVLRYITTQRPLRYFFVLCLPLSQLEVDVWMSGFLNSSCHFTPLFAAQQWERMHFQAPISPLSNVPSAPKTYVGFYIDSVSKLLCNYTKLMTILHNYESISFDLEIW